jgi:peptidoglycan-associated lipoprotein
MKILRAIGFQISLLILLATVGVKAQTTKVEPVSGEGNYNLFYQIGETFVKKGEYYNSIPYLKRAYSKEKDKGVKAYILFQIGDSYRKINDMKNAGDWFDKAIRAGYDNPLAVLYLAEAQKANGNYAEALENFKRYRSIAPDDPRGANGAIACELSREWIKKPTKHVVENVEAINTRYYDFNITFSKRNPRIALFTSSRENATGKEQDGWTGQKYTDLFQTIKDDKGKWSTPQPLSAPINSEFAEGSATYDKSGNNLFFTKCQPAKDRNGNCNIYVARKKGEMWEAPKALNIVGDSVTIGNPALSPDEKTLYFSSEIAGGMGGKDIWMSVYDIQTRSWSRPINLGPKINTVGDEMAPYVASDGTLYFSSTEHIGMGGLDLFKAKFTGARSAFSYKNNPSNAPFSAGDSLPGESPIFDMVVPPKVQADSTVKAVDSLLFYAQQWADPENLKYPINSSYDDFAIVFQEGPGEMGYFSSNREGGKGFDDIYRFSLPPLEFTIQGKVLDIDSRGGVKGASIELQGNDGTIVTVKTDKRGVYIFDKTMVKPNTVYKLTATHKNYLSARGIQSTVGLVESTDLFQDAFLLKSTIKPITLPNIYYDFNKATLRPESRQSLDSLVTILNENPKLVVSINSHTDSRGTDEHNDDLSQRRAQSVVDYLITKGLDPERLIATGYGKRKLKRQDEEIARLKTEEDREAAHQENRRTEFEKIRDDYVPKQRFEVPVKDSLGQNIRIAKPILSSKDSVFFNLKPAPGKEQQPAPGSGNQGGGTNQNTPTQGEERRQQPVVPAPEPARRDTSNEPSAPPVPER